MLRCEDTTETHVSGVGYVGHMGILLRIRIPYVLGVLFYKKKGYMGVTPGICQWVRKYPNLFLIHTIPSMYKVANPHRSHFHLLTFGPRRHTKRSPADGHLIAPPHRKKD